MRPPTDHSTRALALMLVGVALLALGALSLSWHESLLDRYEFRQLQTALATYWIVQEGWQLNHLLPLFGPPWSVPMEFPTYQVLVATWHALTGMPLEQSGRLIGVVFLFLTLPAVYDLLAITGLRRSRRFIVLALILSSPVYLFYARTFMIETTALALAVWFLACWRRALARPRSLWSLAALICAVLAALTKITTFLVFGLPALAMTLAIWRETRQSHPSPSAEARLRLGLAGLVAGISLGVAWWWVLHGDGVKDSNPFTGFLAARELHAWNYGTWALRGDWSFWVKIQENIVRYNLAEGAIAIAMLCVPFAASRVRRVALWSLLGFASGPLVFANLYHIHDYYYAANSLLLVGAAGLLLAAVWDDTRLPRGTNWLALGLMLLFQGHGFYRGYYSHHHDPAPPPPALAGVIRDTVPPDEVVLIYGADWDPLLPYYAQRRALMVPGERENETDLLEQVIDRLPPRRIAAMVVHGERLRAQADFVRERTRRFGFAPEPFARSNSADLYLPSETLPGAARAAAGVELLTVAPGDSFSAALRPDDLATLDLSPFEPRPVAVRSAYGVQSGALDGRPILHAHAPSELVFMVPAGAREIHAIVGLPNAAFAPGQPDITDGITVEILAQTGSGRRQRLYHRHLDPARKVADRGPQSVRLALPPGTTGELLFRLGNGPQGDPTNDWAYWAAINIR